MPLKETDQPDLRGFWGKALRAPTPHPLICHAIDVYYIAERLFHTVLSPQCRTELTKAFSPLGNPVEWVALLMGLHDLGKISPVFQAMRPDLVTGPALPGVAKAGKHRTKETDTPHGIFTAMHLDRLLRRWGTSRSVANDIAVALGGHHGVFGTAGQHLGAKDKLNHHGAIVWQPWVDDFVDCLAELLKLDPPAKRPWSEVEFGWPSRLGLAGLVTISDWIGSGSVPQAQWAGPEVTLGEYPEISRQRAVTTLAKMGLTRWSPPTDTGYQALFGRKAWDWQDRLRGFMAEQSSPGILVIEAPTGTGKSMAALQCAADMVGKLALAGFYWATPTRSTSNQAFQVAGEFLSKQDGSLSLRLLHGSSREYLAVDAELRRRMREEQLEFADVGADEPGGAQDGKVREWYTRHMGLVAPLAVGTVDRALQAGLRARFVTVALTALSNKVVIIDEVHAYDAYMSTLLDRVIWWLGMCHTPVILLSATLPARRRNGLVANWCAGARGQRLDQVGLETLKTVYPSVVWADVNGEKHLPIEVSALGKDRIVRLISVPDENLADWLLEQAADGLCVAAVCTLVRRVEELEAELRKRIDSLPIVERPELIVLTGALANADRARAEAELRKFFGPKGKRPTRAIVIGTAALENGLDLDFDTMASDLAPVDSLIQRLGRVYRFRPITTPPVLAITGVSDTAKGPEFAKHTSRIHHRMILLRTWAIIRKRTHLRLPDDAAELIEAVYGEQPVNPPPDWEARRWTEAEKDLAGVRLREHQEAERRYLPPPNSIHELSELTDDRGSGGRTRRQDGRNRHG